MELQEETYLNFDDVMILPKPSNIESREDVNLYCSHPRYPNDLYIPIIASNMDGVGCFDIARKLIEYDMMTCLRKHYTKEELVDFYMSIPKEKRHLIFFSTGIQKEDLNKINELYDTLKTSINICLDVANGYINLAQEINWLTQCSRLLMVGNICTPEGIYDFADNSVNIVKLGIGSGGVCTTSTTTGIGSPQLSTILNCQLEANAYGIYTCSDGGIKKPADICKAFGAGASIVMIGSMFAGHEESEGEWKYTGGAKYHYSEPNLRNYFPFSSEGSIDGIAFDGRTSIITFDKEKHGTWKEQPYKTQFKFYGMSSEKAMFKYNNVKDYRASEGKEVWIDNKGPIEKTIKQILGGLRSCCTYTNSKNLSDLYKNTTFIKVK